MTEEQDPATSSRSDDEEDSINVQFGSVVVAKLGSFPWWPAMIDASPETGDIYWLDDFEDLSKKNASHYHVVFFDVPGKVTRSWIHSTKVVSCRQHYPDSLTEQEREAVKNLEGYARKRRLVVARSIAEAALCLPVEERRKRHTFLCNFEDTDETTPPKKSRITLHCSPATSVSPPSTKLASIPRATHELVQELSVFATSYPVNDSSPRSSPKDDEACQWRHGEVAFANLKDLQP